MSQFPDSFACYLPADIFTKLTTCMNCRQRPPQTELSERAKRFLTAAVHHVCPLNGESWVEEERCKRERSGGDLPAFCLAQLSIAVRDRIGEGRANNYLVWHYSTALLLLLLLLLVACPGCRLLCAAACHISLTSYVARRKSNARNAPLTRRYLLSHPDLTPSVPFYPSPSLSLPLSHPSSSF